MDSTSPEPSLYTVKAVFILDNDGNRLLSKLMLMSVLNCLFDSTSHILRKNVERRCLLENMEGVFLVVDEIIDGGVILESDPQQVLQKVNYRADENPLTEQSVAQVIHKQTDSVNITAKAIHTNMKASHAYTNAVQFSSVLFI
uniref:Coatomer subunit zeta n=1 Tax=Haplochromis burtoni TaxID=8153 RepID=A0A3Q2X074_HAPBU